MALFVLYMGWMRLQNPIELPTTPMFIAAAGGLVTEFISIRLLMRDQKHSLNVKGAYWHVLQTFVGSLIIIVAAVVIKFTGFYHIDPILGMLFGLVLFWASWSIIKGAFDILLESAPPDIDLMEVKRTIEDVKGVKDAHHMHAWVLTSGKNIFSSHLLIHSKTDPEVVLANVHELLKNKYGFYFSTIQVEKACYGEESKHMDITRKRRSQHGGH